MAFKYKLLLLVTPAVFLLDQLTKLAVLAWVPLGSRIPIIPGFFDLVHFRNTGAAFGILSEVDHGFRVPFFYVVAVIAVVVLGVFYRSLTDRERLMQLAFALVFGGIAGNIVDRIRLGSVVDFVSLRVGDAALDFTLSGTMYHIPLEWPAFNVADMAITATMLLLIWQAIRHGSRA